MCDPNPMALMAPDRLLDTDLDRLPHGDLLERPELRVEQSERETENDCDRIDMLSINWIFAPLQVLLL
jgi:hypothetical protein